VSLPTSRGDKPVTRQFREGVEVSGLEPPTSTLRTCLRRISADSGEPSGQVIELSTPANGGVRGMTAGCDTPMFH
jgi:hypothetical protein